MVVGLKYFSFVLGVSLISLCGLICWGLMVVKFKVYCIVVGFYDVWVVVLSKVVVLCVWGVEKDFFVIGVVEIVIDLKSL